MNETEEQEANKINENLLYFIDIAICRTRLFLLSYAFNIKYLRWHSIEMSKDLSKERRRNRRESFDVPVSFHCLIYFLSISVRLSAVAHSIPFSFHS